MTEERNEILLDLLAKKAICGLDAIEQTQLERLDPGAAELAFNSLEITAAAIGLVGLSTDEPLPADLHARILADADSHFAASEAAAEALWPRESENVVEGDNEISSIKPGGSFSIWFGWTVAAAACLALAINIWFTRFQAKPETATVSPPTLAPEKLTPAQMYAEMAGASHGVVKANWAAGNVKEMKQITGDVVWSDQTQTGYMRLRGLPVNDAKKETYQLWIFDKTRDDTHPIDGGTFDVSSNGEFVIPINAKLKARSPDMFAITVEKPGGVVVSKREKLAAIAKVET